MSLFSDIGLPNGLVRERLLNWSGNFDTTADVVPLRLAGALNFLVLDRRDADLARMFPPNQFDKKQLEAAVFTALIEHAEFISDYLDLPPQTNETARAAMLLPAMLELAARHHLPFNLLELGASAGLLQNLDRFHYNFGTWSWGTSDAAVSLECDWRGSQVHNPDWPETRLEIASRSGCDISPVHVRTAEDEKRLTSYIWPDQSARLLRLKGALDLARIHPPQIDEASAADWLKTKLNQTAPDRCTVICHTIMWQYMPNDEQSLVEQLIRQAGAFATPQTPLAWLRLEADDGKPGAGLYLTHWGGTDPDPATIQLGRGDFHGRWLDWHGMPAEPVSVT